ncbi:hypothetical protein [Dongia rigui]|uniref:Holin n=1 Tax=Dongia rigui TaxID=940149 RepID=A0ABU5DYW2_9PROT|nr:hypothetical protein [Dongia rigui]MDY0872522.1 hypothetical protein [Dongia rigui]
MIESRVAALGTINKAWAAAIGAPIAEWLVGLLADALWTNWQIKMPDSAEMAAVSLLVGLAVYQVPNLPAEPVRDDTQQKGA